MEQIEQCKLAIDTMDTPERKGVTRNIEDLTLIHSGRVVSTIAACPSICFTREGQAFFLKHASHEEYRQLMMFKEMGIPIPNRVAYSDGMLATSFAGYPLSLSPKDDIQKYEEAGELLRYLHAVLNNQSGSVPDAVLSSSEKSTGHIIRNFRYRFLQRQSKATNALLEQRIPVETPLGKLRDSILDTAGSYSFRCSDVDCDEHDRDVIYGDYKSDNILSTGEGGGLVLIDPDVRKGCCSFDIAKFVSRSLLENIDCKSLIHAFLKGYGFHEETEVPYGELHFRDQVAIEMINILSAYAGRWLQNDGTFRLINRFGDQEYLAYLTHLLDGMSSSAHLRDRTAQPRVPALK
ncbi:MAG: hypothetical protein V1876_03365 [Candidatus Peregrinibacteria bacterium]